MTTVPLGRLDGLGVAVLVLPVEVPVVDPQERLDCPIGQGGGQAELAAKVMSVGHDGVKVNIGLEACAQDDLMPLFARGNIDPVRAQDGSPPSFRLNGLRAKNSPMLDRSGSGLPMGGSGVARQYRTLGG